MLTTRIAIFIPGLDQALASGAQTHSYLGRCGVFDLVLLRGEDPEHGGLACIVQAQDQHSQLAARLLSEFAKQREKTLQHKAAG